MLLSQQHSILLLFFTNKQSSESFHHELNHSAATDGDSFSFMASQIHLLCLFTRGVMKETWETKPDRCQ